MESPGHVERAHREEIRRIARDYKQRARTLWKQAYFYIYNGNMHSTRITT